MAFWVAKAVGEFVQVDGLVFERAPEALDGDVVHVAAPAVHGDGDANVFEHSGELEAGELAALIERWQDCIEDRVKISPLATGWFTTYDEKSFQPTQKVLENPNTAP